MRPDDLVKIDKPRSDQKIFHIDLLNLSDRTEPIFRESLDGPDETNGGIAHPAGSCLSPGNSLKI